MDYKIMIDSSNITNSKKRATFMVALTFGVKNSCVLMQCHMAIQSVSKKISHCKANSKGLPHFLYKRGALILKTFMCTITAWHIFSSPAAT